ncbi:MAG: hypothetical protein OEV41_09805 [Gammaproteobacteria bacterium]|nr:hypothetical protein [Gammaproteobacteria bacterium]
MIWAFLAWYFLSGAGESGSMLTQASVNQLSERAAMVIEDASRLSKVRPLFRDLGNEVKAFDKRFAETGKLLTASYLDHTADRGDAIAVLDALNADWEAAQQRALEMRFRLREFLTETEWAALYSSPEDDR